MEKKGFAKTGKSPVIGVVDNDKAAVKCAPVATNQSTEDKKETLKSK